MKNEKLIDNKLLGGKRKVPDVVPGEAGVHSIGSRPAMLLFEKNPGEATKKIPSLGSGDQGD